MWKGAGRAPSLRVLLWHLPYDWGKSTEKNLSQLIWCRHQHFLLYFMAVIFFLLLEVQLCSSAVVVNLDLVSHPLLLWLSPYVNRTQIHKRLRHCHVLINNDTFSSGAGGRSTGWRSWMRHCATSRKVAGSIPDGVIEIFHWRNPSGRTMALGLTQPLTEMNKR